jgi:hypothetical protein
MSNLTRAMMMGAAGAASGDKTYVDDVFNTYLYSPSASQTQIQSGIDFSGEGGMIWKKIRSSAASHHLYDTERGNTKTIYSDLTNVEASSSNDLLSFNSNGVTWDTGGHSGDYVNWSFRKAPGFFDVVTYTGNGAVQNISHSLGSIPGMITVKRLDSGASNWETYHRSTGATKKLELNENAAVSTNSNVWNNTEPTSSVFTVGTNNSSNGANYVAYVFAHDSQVFGTDSDESIIKCGTFNIPGSGTFDVNLGFEPQFILYKQTSGGMGTPNWYMHDAMRGLAQTSFNPLYANATTAESPASTEGYLVVHPTGFKSTSSAHNAGDYVYMAIRRPNKPPEAATEVFDDVIYNGTAGVQNIVNSLLYTDLTWIKRRTSTDPPVITDRLRGDNKYLRTDSIAVEASWASNDLIKLDKMYSFGLDGNATGYHNSSGQPYISWNFKRAPGFFDVVTYAGNSVVGRQITHNLGTAPELMLIKLRSHADSWVVYHKDKGNQYYAKLDTTDAGWDNTTMFNSTTPTSTVFTTNNGGDINYSGRTYVAYLFATLPGISFVGSYTGTGSNINIDCGFTGGARFVLIKRTNSSGDWYVWDTARGIVAGNDPYVLVNSTAAEVTNTDYIDPLNAGFTVTSSAPAALNTSGGTYIFLAIA